MASAVARLKEAIEALQAEIDRDLDERRERWRYRVERGRVRFEAEVRARHRAAKVGLLEFLSYTRPSVVLTAPVIYSLIVPFAALDLWVSVYQAVCFRVYGIARVRRGDHIAFDRHHLAYLNGLQKLNCLYCGYCNGVISYVREIAGRTEQYWCPIKHARRVKGVHDNYAAFLDYGDAEAFQAELERLREALGEGRGS